MTAQAPNANLAENEIIPMSWLQRLGLFLLFMVCETAIFIFGSYYFNAFPTNKNLSYNLAVSAVFLIATLWFRFDKRWNKHWQIPLVFWRPRLPILSRRFSMLGSTRCLVGSP
jgi:hypothetical protein